MSSVAFDGTTLHTIYTEVVKLALSYSLLQCKCLSISVCTVIYSYTALESLSLIACILHVHVRLDPGGVGVGREKSWSKEIMWIGQ